MARTLAQMQYNTFIKRYKVGSQVKIRTAKGEIVLAKVKQIPDMPNENMAVAVFAKHGLVNLSNVIWPRLFRLEIKYSSGCKSYEYLDADENIQKAAEEKANAFALKHINSPMRFSFEAPYTPPRTIQVREIKRFEGTTIKKGLKFKLRLNKTTVKKHYNSETIFHYTADEN